jgi:hypothetical protein
LVVVATSINAERSVEALRRIRNFVQEHGSDEQQARLDAIQGGIIPAPSRDPISHAAYQAEALVIALEMVGELKEANKPRPRGRPRKEPAA